MGSLRSIRSPSPPLLLLGFLLCFVYKGTDAQACKEVDGVRLKDAKSPDSKVYPIGMSLTLLRQQDSGKLRQAFKECFVPRDTIQVVEADTDSWDILSSDIRLLKNVIADIKEKMNEEITVSDLFVVYKETVADISSKVSFSRSPNKVVNIEMTAEPLDRQLTTRLEKGKVSVDDRNRAAMLTGDFDWDQRDARNILGFGPDVTRGPNIMVDDSGDNFIEDKKNWFTLGLMEVTSKGILAEEPVWGVLIKVTKVFEQSIAGIKPGPYGNGQYNPAIISCARGAMYTADPRLMQPLLTVTWSFDLTKVDETEEGAIIQELKGINSGVVNIISREVKDDQAEITFDDLNGAAYIFIDEKRGSASATSFHWAVIDSDPLDPNSVAGQLVGQIRKRKGLRPASASR